MTYSAHIQCFNLSRLAFPKNLFMGLKIIA